MYLLMAICVDSAFVTTSNHHQVMAMSQLGLGKHRQFAQFCEMLKSDQEKIRKCLNNPINYYPAQLNNELTVKLRGLDICLYGLEST